MSDITDEAVQKALEAHRASDGVERARIRAALEAAAPLMPCVCPDDLPKGVCKHCGLTILDHVLLGVDRGHARIRELEDGIRRHRDAPMWGDADHDDRLWALLPDDDR